MSILILIILFFNGKVAASVVNSRRAGTTAAFEQLNQYYTMSNMPVVSSQYWNDTHGGSPKDVIKDLQGMQTMRILGKNMAWLIKCIKSGEKNGIKFPQLVKFHDYPFIR